MSSGQTQQNRQMRVVGGSIVERFYGSTFTFESVPCLIVARQLAVSLRRSSERFSEES